MVDVDRAVLISDEPLRLSYRHALHSWAAGQRDEVIEISTDVVTGYRLLLPSAGPPEAAT